MKQYRKLTLSSPGLTTSWRVIEGFVNGGGGGGWGFIHCITRLKKTFQETSYIAVVIKIRFELFAPFITFETS